MQFKKVILTGMLIAGSVLAITSCSTSSSAKKAGISGKIEKGDVIAATCTLQGIDNTGTLQGTPTTITFNAKNSTYSTSTVPKDTAVEVSCKVTKYINEITNTIESGKDGKDFTLTTVSKADASTANMNVLTTLASKDTIDSITSDADIAELMKTNIGNAYRSITGNDLPTGYNPATSNLNDKALRQATIAVLYKVNDADEKSSLTDIFGGKVKVDELASAFTAADRLATYKKFQDEGHSTGLDVDNSKVTESPSITLATFKAKTKSAILGAVSATHPALADATWDGDVSVSSDAPYTLVLPSTYKDSDTVNFGIKVTNGKDKYLVISNGKDTSFASAKIVVDTEKDIDIADIHELLTGVATKDITLYVCVLDTAATRGTDCTDTKAKLADLIVSVVKPTIIFKESKIGSKTISQENVGGAGNGAIHFNLHSKDVHNAPTDVKYFIVSDVTPTAAAKEVTLGHDKDVISLFKTTDLTTFTVCMLAATRATGSDCTSAATVDRIKVLATAIFKAQTGNAAMPAALGDVSATGILPARATSSATTIGKTYKLILPSDYTDTTTAKFVVKVKNGNKQLLVIGDGTLAPVVSDPVSGDTDADTVSADIKDLIKGISATTPKSLFLCVLPAKPAPAVADCGSAAAKHLATLAVSVVGPAELGTIKTDPVLATQASGTVGNDYTLSLTHKEASNPVAFTINVTNGDGKFLVVSNGSGDIDSSDIITGNNPQYVTINNIRWDWNVDKTGAQHLFVCLVDKGNQNNPSACAATKGKSAGKLTVTVAAPITIGSIIFRGDQEYTSTIGSKSIQGTTAGTKAVGTVSSTINFHLGSTDVAEPATEIETKHYVTYAITSDKSNAQQFVATVGTNVDVHELFKGTSETKFTVCMLAYGTDKTACSDNVSTSQTVLAVATFTAVGASVLLGDITGIAPHSGWSDTATDAPKLVLPHGATNVTSVKFEIAVTGTTAGKSVAVSNGTDTVIVAPIVSSKATVDYNNPHANVDKMKALLKDIANGAKLYICVLDTQAAATATNCNNNTADKTLTVTAH